MPLIDKIEGDHSTMAEEVSVMAKTQRGKAAVDIMARREHSIVTLPAAIVDKEQIEENINLLRRFHLGDPRAAKTTQLIGDDLLPALLDVYRGRPGIRYDYPLFLRSPESESEAPLAEPLSDFLSRSIETFAPGQDSARMLKDNLPRLERYIDKKLKDSSEPCDARPKRNRPGGTQSGDLAEGSGQTVGKC
jgi:hypothetical protein